MSRNAITFSPSWTRSAGISPATMRQKMQSLTRSSPLVGGPADSRRSSVGAQSLLVHELHELGRRVVARERDRNDVLGPDTDDAGGPFVALRLQAFDEARERLRFGSRGRL